MPKIARNKRYYWLITISQETLCIETKILTVGNYKSMSRQLQNNGQF